MRKVPLSSPLNVSGSNLIPENGYFYDGPIRLEPSVTGTDTCSVIYTNGLETAEITQGKGAIGGILTTCFDGATAFYDCLYYYGHRFYMPEVGRWASRDPIAERGGRNLFVLTLNNPLNSVDMLGASEFKKWVVQVLVEITIALSNYSGPSEPPTPSPPDPSGPPITITVTNSGSECLEYAPATSSSSSVSLTTASAAAAAGAVTVYVLYISPVGRVISAAAFLIQITVNGGASCCPWTDA